MGPPAARRRCRRRLPMVTLCLSTALAVTCLAPAHRAAAQDPGSLDQLKRMYDETLGQLKAAQDRKNELAAENERLATRVRELEEQLAATTARVDQYRRDAATDAERTFFLRSHYAAWRQFLDRHPDLVARWKVFLGDGMTVPKPGAAQDVWPFDDRPSPLG